MTQILQRKENGKLGINSLTLEIFLGDLFGMCNTEHEINWLMDEIIGSVENLGDERINEIVEIVENEEIEEEE